MHAYVMTLSDVMYFIYWCPVSLLNHTPTPNLQFPAKYIQPYLLHVGVFDKLLIFGDCFVSYRINDLPCPHTHCYWRDMMGLDYECLWHPLGRIFIVDLFTEEVDCFWGNQVGTVGEQSI